MTGPIHPHNKTHDAAKTQPKELYSRVLHELKLSVEAAAGDVIVENLPNYRAVLQAIKSAKSLKGRVTGSMGSTKSAITKTATKVDLSSASHVLRHKGHLAQASRMKYMTPYGR